MTRPKRMTLLDHKRVDALRAEAKPKRKPRKEPDPIAKLLKEMPGPYRIILKPHMTNMPWFEFIVLDRYGWVVSICQTETAANAIVALSKKRG